MGMGSQTDHASVHAIPTALFPATSWRSTVLSHDVATVDLQLNRDLQTY